MIVFAMDRDHTVTTSNGPVPVEWVSWVHVETDHVIYAVGNQRLVDEAGVPGRETLYDEAGRDDIELGSRQSKTESYATLAALYPDADEYVAVDDDDRIKEVAEAAGFDHYYPEDFVDDFAGVVPPDVEDEETDTGVRGRL